MPDINNKIAYIIAVVNEFATRYSLNSQQAYRYLDRFKGIDFVDKFYGVEHTQSFEDVVDDLSLIDYLEVELIKYYKRCYDRSCDNKLPEVGPSLKVPNLGYIYIVME